MSSRPRAPTIVDVARRAGTSIASVSNVLNNKDRSVGPELRARILAVAGELGYVKNAVASRLKGKQRGLIAVLVPQFGNNFFTRICVDVESVAREAGYVVIICNSDESIEQERAILERLIAQRIDGCILCPALSQTRNAELLQQHRMPTVILERPLGTELPAHDFVGHDNRQAGYLATRALLEAGHRNIAFIGWNSPIPNIRHRADGYVDALREFGLTPRPDWLLQGELDLNEGRRMVASLPIGEITALVLANHLDLGKGALMELHARGLRWPDDLSVVLVGTPDWCDLVTPALTCIERPEAEMGRRAATLLLSKVAAPERDGPQLVLPVTLRDGQSVKTISHDSADRSRG
ncbi:MAG TPA: LacI family DNA-binding transcriptional regulator [Paraburkholderia sp.]